MAAPATMAEERLIPAIVRLRGLVLARQCVSRQSTTELLGRDAEDEEEEEEQKGGSGTDGDHGGRKS